MAVYRDLKEALEKQISQLTGLPEVQGPQLARLLEKLKENRFNPWGFYIPWTTTPSRKPGRSFLKAILSGIPENRAGAADFDRGPGFLSIRPYTLRASCGIVSPENCSKWA